MLRIGVLCGQCIGLLLQCRDAVVYIVSHFDSNLNAKHESGWKHRAQLHYSRVKVKLACHSMDKDNSTLT